MTNCPNCGAPIDNYIHVKCPYCGTDYFDFAVMDTNKPFWIKIRIPSGDVILASVILRSATMETICMPLYADNLIFSHSQATDISLDMSVVESMTSEIPGLRFINRKE